MKPFAELWILLILLARCSTVTAFGLGLPRSMISGSRASSTGLSATNRNNDKIKGVRQLYETYEAINEMLGRRKKQHFLESSAFAVTPLGAAIASFFWHPTTTVWFHQAVNALSGNNWEPVDGGALQWSILLPALNGVVMTAISLLYANLISTTGTQLRDRQITVHSSLSLEVEGLRDLIPLIAYYPAPGRHQCADYLKEYIGVLVHETDPNQQYVMDLRSNSPPLSQYRYTLHKLSIRPTNLMNANILDQSYQTLQRVTDARSARVTSLQTKFPSLHYVTITALSAAILLIFLMETDRSVILFLDKFQIRAVWSLLVGTITAIYCIGIDLSNPFIGTYTVPAEQLLEDKNELLSLIQTRAGTPVEENNNFSESAPAAPPLTMPVDEVPVPAGLNGGMEELKAEPMMLTSPQSRAPRGTNEDMSLDKDYMIGRNSEEQAPTRNRMPNAYRQAAPTSAMEDFESESPKAQPTTNEGMSLYEEYMRRRNQ